MLFDLSLWTTIGVGVDMVAFDKKYKKKLFGPCKQRIIDILCTRNIQGLKNKFAHIVGKSFMVFENIFMIVALSIWTLNMQTF
jgi:hypothetical protein